MFAPRFAVVVAGLLFVGESLGKNVPGPGDPDTYPGQTIKCEVSPGVVIEESIVGPPDDLQIITSDIKIFFHSNKDPGGTLLDNNDPSGSLARTNFSTAKETYFAIHGWRNDNTSEMFTIIKGALIPSKDVNLFIVDWGKIAQRNYITARWNVAYIGNLVGDFIKNLVDHSNLNLTNTKIVGHSLGAHVSGFAGAILDGQVRVIIGLDPAWPLFFFSKSTKRLSEGDARFVQVIHTNGRMLGFPYSIGTADYYPNGGNSQAGCFLDIAGTCAHSRSYQYYGESIKSQNFVSSKCDSYKLFKRGQCQGNRKSKMGEFLIDSSANGDYYLDTNTQAPFAKGG